MKKYYTITCIGKDRPGIVAGISKELYDNGANIEDSSMTVLREQFAMILIVSMTNGYSPEQLESSFAEAAKKLKLIISVKGLDLGEIASVGDTSGKPYLISVIGTDKPGIVYKLSDFLASRNINIVDMNTKVIPGETDLVYTMLIEVIVHDDIDIDELEDSLAILEREMSIDLNIREVEVLNL